MSGKLFDKYGAILQEDVDVLEECLEVVCDAAWARDRVVRVCEIGMHDGGTAKGIEAFVRAKGGLSFDYWGIDPDPGTTRPRYVPERATVIIGDSAEVFSQVPDNLNLVWVDGCHCVNHVILDTIHYLPKVLVGGFACYHDAHPKTQGSDHQYHGPQTPDFGLAVLKALNLLSFPHASPEILGKWSKFAHGYPTDPDICGTLAFERDS